jgi:hypothetical protein
VDRWGKSRTAPVSGRVAEDIDETDIVNKAKTARWLSIDGFTRKAIRRRLTGFIL